MITFNIENNFKIQKQWNGEDGYYWILLNSSEAEELNYLFHKECIEECLDYKQNSRIDYYKEYLFMVINILEQGEREILSKELDIFLSKNLIITVYKDKIKLIEEIIKDINLDKNCLLLKDVKRPCMVLYYILDRLIINNYNIISDLEVKGDSIEIEILKEPKGEQLNKLLFVRREAYKVRKLLKPLRYIGENMLLNENGIIEDENLFYFRNINRKIDKLMLTLDNLSQELALVREAYESEIANKTNELMKVFTIITAVFLPLELITALFSMSFDYMPFKGNCYAFYGILIFMALLVIYLLRLFKNKNIL
ncbi:magnesium transporter [Clostridium cavendishii DSM 21758]|uniref:Magnesium transporter n=1 Tax=Clostridium cavendishii DSM 21758 TaxID=1121302 RepID=A0A1M6ETX8_9CLOT|nr:magnesium transporter CorA family protein [Clostridium cavendishii]SHI88839.1 magnesium transporter [Clostridium cavendishii DSM 21758]